MGLLWNYLRWQGLKRCMSVCFIRSNSVLLIIFHGDVIMCSDVCEDALQCASHECENTLYKPIDSLNH